MKVGLDLDQEELLVMETEELKEFYKGGAPEKISKVVSP